MAKYSKVKNEEARGRRALIHEQQKIRFISPMERMARCEAAAQSMGYRSIFSLGLEHGITHTSMKSSLNSVNPSVSRIEQLAIMLKCSVSYLTERKIVGLK